MSGRKQHYIPQLFLRGFLICQQSGQTHVYRRDKMFISKTDSVAAQRIFTLSQQMMQIKLLMIN